jgi:hypothetical protein
LKRYCESMKFAAATIPKNKQLPTPNKP